MFSFIRKYQRKRTIIKELKLVERRVKEIMASDADPLLKLVQVCAAYTRPVCAAYTRLECLVRAPIEPPGLKKGAQVIKVTAGEAIRLANNHYAASVEFGELMKINLDGKELGKWSGKNE